MDKLICGLKLTHDGGVAVVEGDRLLFAIEAEKLANRERYSPLNRPSDIAAVLGREGLTPADLSAVAVDGWAHGPGGEAWVELVGPGDERTPVDVADYEDTVAGNGALLTGTTSRAPLFGAAEVGFRSFSHGTDHAMASYCTSPFAAAGRPALVLVWDGGMGPCLYRFDPAAGGLTTVGSILPVTGGLYPTFASHFGPFRIDHSRRRASSWAGPSMEALLPISGKAMAYAALSEPSEEAIARMATVTAELLPILGGARSFMWSRQVRSAVADLGLSDAAVLASFQEHLGRLLLGALRDALAADPALRDLPICLSGGCALNIKWNAAIRRSGLFEDVWVPPFPNDAGSAIGAACAEMVRRTGNVALRWSVFSGPQLLPTAAPEPGWRQRPCDVEELAKILELEGEPVVVVDGRAELGPRALGHRSIVAAATSSAMRDRLNDIKGREHYRPVAPICLESRAPEVFAPGGSDPYMLFEHAVRPDWAGRVPAVVHADGSARLQTVGPDNGLVHELLTAYERSTGIPVLCNTSANFNGCGFFPDAASAMRWRGTRHVWSGNVLYTDEAAPPASV